MNDNFLVIFESSGIVSNNEIEKILKNKLYNIISFPILHIDPLHKKPIKLKNAQAILTTSSNAIQIFSGLSNNRMIPLYTVGSTLKK